jgi:hypothetical protein
VRVLLLWVNAFSLFGINRQKRRLCERFLLSPLLVQVNMSEKIIPIEEWCEVTTKDKRYWWSGVEALSSSSTPFPFQSTTQHRNTLENTLVAVMKEI